jgi:hypothetical protein
MGLYYPPKKQFQIFEEVPVELLVMEYMLQFGDEMRSELHAMKKFEAIMIFANRHGVIDRLYYYLA